MRPTIPKLRTIAEVMDLNEVYHAVVAAEGRTTAPLAAPVRQRWPAPAPEWPHPDCAQPVPLPAFLQCFQLSTSRGRPSGDASVFGTDIRRFDPSRPSHLSEIERP